MTVNYLWFTNYCINTKVKKYLYVYMFCDILLGSPSFFIGSIMHYMYIYIFISYIMLLRERLEIKGENPEDVQWCGLNV